MKKFLKQMLGWITEGLAVGAAVWVILFILQLFMPLPYAIGGCLLASLLDISKQLRDIHKVLIPESPLPQTVKSNRSASFVSE